jgi:hypothetical protein
MTSEEEEQHAIELIWGPAKMDGKKAAEEFIQHLSEIDVQIGPTMTDHTEFGRTYVEVWQMSFMNVWMPWIAEQLEGR